MDALASADILLFEDFRLDRRGGGLFRRDESGEFVPVPIGSRALDILDSLIARAGEVASKDEIIAAVWPGLVVEDSNLTVQISALRRVLDRGRAQGSLIQTVPGRGYRFVAEVTRVEGRDLSGLAAIRPPISEHLPPRLSIVVLPFANLSNDPDQQYFADAVTEDLTVDLSRLANMVVISRNTAFTYKNKPTDTKQIGRDLGVRYVMEGSVRRSGHRLRVTAQLIDATTDTHLWAERFDRDAGDLFALQNEITAELASALGVELIAAEVARPADHPDALDYILRGRAVRLKARTRESLAEQISLFEHALVLDRQSIDAQTRLAAVLANRVLGWMSNSASTDIARAESLVNCALAASPHYALAHYVKGAVLRAQNRWQEAITEQETALALDRNLMNALYELGYCKLLAGSSDEVIPLVERAIRLSPREPSIGYRYFQIGEVNLLQSHIDEAIAWLEKARSDIPAVPNFRSFLSSAYALGGDIQRAAVELAEARRLDDGVLFSSITALKSGRSWVWGSPKTRALYEGTYFAGLRKAGMPEE